MSYLDQSNENIGLPPLCSVRAQWEGPIPCIEYLDDPAGAWKPLQIHAFDWHPCEAAGSVSPCIGALTLE